METNVIDANDACSTCLTGTSLSSQDLADIGQCRTCYRTTLRAHFKTRTGLSVDTFRTDINRLMKAGKWGSAQNYLKLFIESNSKILLDSYERLYK